MHTWILLMGQFISPSGLTVEATPPQALVIEQERCRGFLEETGEPGKQQSEIGILAPIPRTLGLADELRPYVRTACVPER